MSVKNILILFLAVSLLFSCNHSYTAQMWNKQKIITDEIDSFVVSKNLDKIIFVSNDYHYIFDTNAKAVEILNWSDMKGFRVYLSKSFNLDSKNIITGSFVLGAKKNEVTPSQLINMKNIGFTQNSYTHEYTLKIDLSGERFLSKGVNFENLGVLSQKYLVHIKVDNSLSDKLVLTAATPFSVALDVTIAAAFLVVIVISQGKVLNKRASEKEIKQH